LLYCPFQVNPFQDGEIKNPLLRGERCGAFSASRGVFCRSGNKRFLDEIFKKLSQMVLCSVIKKAHTPSPSREGSYLPFYLGYQR